MPSEYNISEDLASYMVMSLDMSIKNYTEFMKELLPPGHYQTLLEQQEEGLTQLLANHNFTNLLDVFRAIAIECRNFLPFCDDHRVFFLSDVATNDTNKHCCGIVFNNEPFFTPMGTCFSSKRRLNETIPASFSALTILVDSFEKLTPSTETIEVSCLYMLSKGSALQIFP